MAVARVTDKKLVADLKKITVYCTEKERDDLQVAIRQRPNAPESVNQLMGILGRLYLVDQGVQKAVDSYVLADRKGAPGHGRNVLPVGKKTQKKAV